MHLRGVFANKLESFLQGDLLNCGHLVRVRHALNASRFFHDFWTESRGDELRLIVRLTFDHVRHGGAVLRVERGVDFVEEVKRHRIAALNGKDERNSDDSLLPARQLLHLHSFTLSEAHLDLHAAILLAERGRISRRFALFLRVPVRHALALHDEFTAATGDESMEDVLEIHADLFESTFDRFILLVI